MNITQAISQELKKGKDVIITKNISYFDGKVTILKVEDIDKNLSAFTHNLMVNDKDINYFNHDYGLHITNNNSINLDKVRTCDKKVTNWLRVKNFNVRSNENSKGETDQVIYEINDHDLFGVRFPITSCNKEEYLIIELYDIYRFVQLGKLPLTDYIELSKILKI